MQGAVTVIQTPNAEGVAAQLNLPLLQGVQLATGVDGQAEVEFEDGSVIRLTPNSALSFDNLSVASDGTFVTTLSLGRGLAYCELRATPQYSYRLNAGGDMVSPVENTTVRVNFDEPPATFAVLDGTAEVDRPSAVPGAEVASSGYQTQVHAGESLRADPQNENRYFLTQGIAVDSWDQWNEDLDQSAASEAADSTTVRNDYAGAQGYGWSDLDANGDWYNVPGQGPVWQPQVAEVDPGFDPYGNGAWVLYPGTGYLWASNYAWGWTPYRCGNWSYFNGFGWGWAPGAGCGGLGWGFAGGGAPVNIVLVPVGYRPIHVPVIHPGPVRPIVPVHPLAVQALIPPGPRHISGVVVSRIEPIGDGSVPGGTIAGSSLRRDFPVDSTTHSPVLGLAGTAPAVVHRSSESSSGYVSSRPSPASTSPVYPGYSGQSRPASTDRFQSPPPRSSPPPSCSRPAYTRAPSTPRAAPAPAASHPASAPAASRSPK
jgi:hypothetical protein